MSAGANYTIHKDHHHHGWDNANPPALTVAPGDVVDIEVFDASGGQLTPTSTAADVDAFVFETINPVTGPILVDGAEPGDALKITLLSFRPSGWGWTAIIPGFGLLAGDFPDSHLIHWNYDAASLAPALFEGARCAVRGMIELLTARHGLSAEQAYMLCSVCADLRISEIVDAPNWLVSLYFPRLVLE